MTMGLSFVYMLLGSGLIFQASGTPLSSPFKCCELLDKEFRGEQRVVYPQTSEYGALNTYFAQTSQLAPSCIFSPADATDVSRAIRLFTRNSCAFAIRSGGHHYNAGWASINNGILVSLSNLNKVVYTAATESVYVGAGNRWLKVYNAVEPYNVTVAGAQNADVGVGGFLINGGITYLSNEYGWAVDNVREFEVVVADGRVLRANKHRNQDLFRALKGGSSNFGVVTGFTLNTVKINAFNSMEIGFPESSFDAMIDTAHQYCIKGVDEDPKSQVMIASFMGISNGTVSTQNAALVTYADVLNLSKPPKVIAPFVDGRIPSAGMSSPVKNATLGAQAHYLTTLQKPGGRTTRQTVSIISDAALLKNMLTNWVKVAEPYLDVEGFGAGVLLQPIGKKWIEHGNIEGGNSMGLTEPVVLVWVQPHWTSSRVDKRMNEFTSKVIALFERAAKDAGKLAGFHYLNYAGPKQELIESYGKESVQRLQRVKWKYDPKNVFGTLLPGGPKVPGFKTYG